MSKKIGIILVKRVVEYVQKYVNVIVKFKSSVLISGGSSILFYFAAAA